MESDTHNSTFLDEMSQLICRPLLQARLDWVVPHNERQRPERLWDSAPTRDVTRIQLYSVTKYNKITFISSEFTKINKLARLIDFLIDDTID